MKINKGNVIMKRTKKRGKSKQKAVETLLSDPESFYVVERLLDRSYTKDGKEEYLVKWRDWSPSWNSWEPVEELQKGCKDMIDEYNRNSRTSPDAFRQFCVCRKPYRFDDGAMIQCRYCLNWFHFSCLGITLVEANKYQTYYCDNCREANPNLRNVFVSPGGPKVVRKGFFELQDDTDEDDDVDI